MMAVVTSSAEYLWKRSVSGARVAISEQEAMFNLRLCVTKREAHIKKRAAETDFAIDLLRVQSNALRELHE